MRLTDKGIANLKPKNTRYIEWKDNGEGLGIRISPKGRKTFIFMYRYLGRTRMMSLGHYPKITLVTANIAYANARALLDKGQDPGAIKVLQNQEDRVSPTILMLVNEYIERWAKPRKRSWAEDARIFNKDILPRWSKLKAKDIKRRDVNLVLDDIIARNSPIAANRSLAAVRKLFNFAITRDYIDISPCNQIKAPAVEKRRDRILNDDEIYKMWHGLDSANMANLTALALKLQLVTAQRIGEITQATWEEVNVESGWWTIGAARTKNKMSHRVPLTNLAFDLLNEIRQTTNNTVWLFPSPRKGKPIATGSMSHAVRNNLVQLEIGQFTPHDLRRTAASHMASLGISRLVLSKILNHAEYGVDAVYDRHTYDDEKLNALTLWSTKLKVITQHGQI